MSKKQTVNVSNGSKILENNVNMWNRNNEFWAAYAISVLHPIVPGPALTEAGAKVLYENKKGNYAHALLLLAHYANRDMVITKKVKGQNVEVETRKDLCELAGLDYVSNHSQSISVLKTFIDTGIIRKRINGKGWLLNPAMVATTRGHISAEVAETFKKELSQFFFGEKEIFFQAYLRKNAGEDINKVLDEAEKQCIKLNEEAKKKSTKASKPNRARTKTRAVASASAKTDTKPEDKTEAAQDTKAIDIISDTDADGVDVSLTPEEKVKLYFDTVCEGDRHVYPDGNYVKPRIIADVVGKKNIRAYPQEGDRHPKNTDPKKMTCINLVMDFDAHDGTFEERTAAISYVHDNVMPLLPVPTLVVFTGHGYQAYWHLKEKIRGDVYNETIKRIVSFIPVADRNTANANNLFRCPCTLNVRKGLETVMSDFDPSWNFDISAKYSLDELVSLFDERLESLQEASLEAMELHPCLKGSVKTPAATSERGSCRGYDFHESKVTPRIKDIMDGTYFSFDYVPDHVTRTFSSKEDFQLEVKKLSMPELFGIDATIGHSFSCILPPHGDAHPSATMYLNDDGTYKYVCSCACDQAYDNLDLVLLLMIAENKELWDNREEVRKDKYWQKQAIHYIQKLLGWRVDGFKPMPQPVLGGDRRRLAL